MVAEARKTRYGSKRIVKMPLACSLVESHRDTESYSIHPVVHDWCVLALTVVGFAVPESTEPEYWVMQQRLLPHANRCVPQFSEVNVADVDKDRYSDDVFHSLGLLYAGQGKMAEAEKMYQRALEGKEKAWGPEHTSTPSATRAFFTKLRARWRRRMNKGNRRPQSYINC